MTYIECVAIEWRNKLMPKLDKIQGLFGRSTLARVFAWIPFVYLFGLVPLVPLPLWVPITYFAISTAGYYYYMKIRLPMIQREAACQLIFGHVTCRHKVYRAANPCSECDREFIETMKASKEIAERPLLTVPPDVTVH